MLFIRGINVYQDNGAPKCDCLLLVDPLKSSMCFILFAAAEAEFELLQHFLVSYQLKDFSNVTVSIPYDYNHVHTNIL